MPYDYDYIRMEAPSELLKKIKAAAAKGWRVIAFAANVVWIEKWLGPKKEPTDDNTREDI